MTTKDLIYISLRLPKELWRELSQMALDLETSKTAIILMAVEEYLKKKKKK